VLQTIFFALLSARAVDRKIDFSVKEALMTMEKNTGESPTSTSAPYQVGMLLDDVAAENEVLALGRRSSLFLKITITTKQNQNKDGYTYGHNSVPRPPPLEFDGANESQQPAQQLLAVRFAPTNPPTQ
jgi:hypothetical protein